MNLPDMPSRIARLPKDDRGYPVPWFVAWIDGKPDFRVVDTKKLSIAHNKNCCWVCGDVMGVHRVYVIGPMCVINRVTSEPGCHRGCAEWSVQACPFLSKPRMRRNEKNMPDHQQPGGIMIARNPGVMALYEALGATPFQTGEGVLFRLSAPTRVDWWTEGRPATRAEAWASIEGGYPTLLNLARQEGAASIDELERMKTVALEFLPRVEARAS